MKLQIFSALLAVVLASAAYAQTQPQEHSKHHPPSSTESAAPPMPMGGCTEAMQKQMREIREAKDPADPPAADGGTHEVDGRHDEDDANDAWHGSVVTVASKR